MILKDSIPLRTPKRSTPRWSRAIKQTDMRSCSSRKGAYLSGPLSWNNNLATSRDNPVTFFRLCGSYLRMSKLIVRQFYSFQEQIFMFSEFVIPKPIPAKKVPGYKMPEGDTAL